MFDYKFFYCFPVLSLLLLLPLLCHAGGTEGATPFNFLFMDANARPAALGGAYAAAAQDANALLYNPAGLAGIEHHQATFQHTEHFENVTQEYGAIALKQGFGFMINTLSFGKIQRTTVSNPRGTGLGTFGVLDWAVSLGYGRKFRGGFVNVGLAVKYLREKIDTVKAKAGAVDIGVMLHPSPSVSFGLAVQNLGPKARFQSAKEALPLNVKAGLAWQFLNSGLFVTDINLPKHGSLTIHIGGEYVAYKMLALRIGYNGRNDAGSGITAGGGFQFSNLSIDYAFVPYGDLGNSHRMSLSYKWGSR